MSHRLEGRIAIVTGAASGIGEATVRRFLAEGASVLAVDLSQARLAQVHPAHDKLRLIGADVAIPESPKRIVEAAIDAFSGLDILVNNAGVCDYRSIEETTDEVWERTLSIDLTAIFRLTRAAIPALRKSSQGRILNTASIMAERPYPSLVAYTSAKHGVAGLTKSLAVELGADGITANYVLPGAVVTGITKPILEADPSVQATYDRMSVLGRMAQPEEIASAFLFLASDEAGFITGHGLAVDGGALLRL